MSAGQPVSSDLRSLKDAECEPGRLRHVKDDILKWKVKSEKIKAREKNGIRSKCLILVGYDLRRWWQICFVKWHFCLCYNYIILGKEEQNQIWCVLAPFRGEPDSETLASRWAVRANHSCAAANVLAKIETKMFLKTESNRYPPLRLASYLPVYLGCSFYPSRI